MIIINRDQAFIYEILFFKCFMNVQPKLQSLKSWNLNIHEYYVLLLAKKGFGNIFMGRKSKGELCLRVFLFSKPTDVYVNEVSSTSNRFINYLICSLKILVSSQSLANEFFSQNQAMVRLYISRPCRIKILSSASSD